MLGAGGAARAAVYALRRAGAADVMVWNRTRGAGRAAGRRPRRARRRRAGAARDRGQLHERRACAKPTSRSRACPCRPIRWASAATWWTWSTGPAAPRSSPRRSGGERPWSTGLEILVAQGAASFERWTGMTAPPQAMRGAVDHHARAMNPPTEAAAAPKGKPKRSNGITTPSRRGGSGRVLTDVIVDLGFVERDAMDEAIEMAHSAGSAAERVLRLDRRDHRGAARPRGRRALRPRPPRPARLPRRPRRRQARHARRRSSATRPSPSPSPATARCSSPWPTRPTCSPSTTSRS